MKLAILPLAAGLLLPANAQHWIAPSARSFLPPNQAVEVTHVTANIDIKDQAATTTLRISLRNPTGAQLESQILLPVPDGAVLRSFEFQGGTAEATARILPKDEARRLYDSIVARSKDPALLEFAGAGVLRSSVFPVPPRGEQAVRLTYEQLLPADGSRVDYRLPRSESLNYRIPWTISVRVHGAVSLASVYSPSHDLRTERRSEREIAATVDRTTQPGTFVLSALRQKDNGLTASLLAYPDPKVGGGYFLILAAPPARDPASATIKREVTLVIDRSGSMAGEKLDQARAAARQVLEGLAEGEAFNIILYSEAVESFAPQPVIKTPETTQRARDYITGLRVSGGTNIHDALVESLRQKPTPGMLPLVLFLTDGLPTVGQTSEKAIREVVARGNPHQRRVFTFGVGLDVNTPLLSRIARETRATATYVLPKEDVEVKVGQVFQRLQGPVLTAPRLQVVDANGQPVGGRITELLPSTLPDIFANDQLILLGQYRGEAPIKLELSGDWQVGQRKFEMEFPLDKATTANAFVPRLWAANKIAVLTEAIRDLGADSGPFSAPPVELPKAKELVDEVVRLSKEFGILTEYTAFFAEEGTNLAQAAAARQTLDNYSKRAWSARSGAAGVNQEANIQTQKEKKTLNRSNSYADANLNSVQFAKVQQISDRAFFQRGGQWVDSRVIDQAGPAPRIVEIGSPEFSEVVTKLVASNRQNCLALGGEILVEVDGQATLIRAGK